MSNIDPTRTRSSFFPNSKTKQTNLNQIHSNVLKRNDSTRKAELDNLVQKDSKIKIPDAVKDFSRIKRAVDMAPEIDNTDKIAKLKSQIQSGTYNVDFEAVADKLLKTEL